MSEAEEVPLELLNQGPADIPLQEDSLELDAHLTFVRRKGKYVAVPCQQYENSLLAGVGFLEFFNALDFPANVWNKYPTPAFVPPLMGVCGSTIILGSCFAFWDMHRCKRNMKFLWKERRNLQNWRRRRMSTNDPGSERLVAACMDMNFRELGWEVADRFLLDALLGVGGILVGIGTIMAIAGADPVIFLVSNIFSGYGGNSFGAIYFLFNVVWARYMWRRTRFQSKQISKLDGQIEPLIRCRLRSHARRHIFYALFNAATVFVAAVGSLVSATKWEGYVVLIPPIISSIFLNFFWRHNLGYNRDSMERCIGIHDFDILGRLKLVMAINDDLMQSPSKSVQLEEISAGKWNADVLKFFQENGLYNDFCARLLRDPGDAKEVLGTMDEVVVMAPEKILAVDKKLLADTARSCIQEVGAARFRDQERFLLELVACYLSADVPQSPVGEEKDRGSDVSQVMNGSHQVDSSTTTSSSNIKDLDESSEPRDPVHSEE